MAPRRKSRAPSYRDLFGDDGSGTSSSGPSSSGPSSSTAVPDSQPSQRVAWSLGLTTVLAGAFRKRLRVTTTGHIRTGARLQITLRSRGLKCLRTKDKDGNLPMLHRTGQKPHAGIRLDVLAPRKKGRIVGIGSVNQVARATSSYTSRRDEETSQMKARMDSQQVRLDSLEDLLDVMAVGNPVMQRMLSQRRAALGLPVRDPQESDPTRQQPSNPTDYFDDM
uniref:Uncharacterized protein n=1 Tax=Brassica campestris TaxID=3711 RepID=M4FCZ1_BRACM